MLLNKYDRCDNKIVSKSGMWLKMGEGWSVVEIVIGYPHERDLYEALYLDWNTILYGFY